MKPKPRVKKEFQVDILRIGYSKKSLNVVACSLKDAKQKALDLAANFAFSEHDADYRVNDVHEK